MNKINNFQKMNKKIRTRFAPSPTGYLHVGGLRTALYNYLFAKKSGGDFILRIEDTDRSRFVEGAIENLVKSLEKMGLDIDEGVFIDNGNKISQKGNFGPYMQSERLEIYQKYIQELIDKDLAYYCFCTAERLDEVRKNRQAEKLPPMYDGHCRNLSKEEVSKRIEAGEKYVIRFKTPKEDFTEFEDLVYGKIKIKNEIIDDQILIKSDGFPTYHFANVIDDHLMEISHVIRGEEWISSTPKHILLYQAFGWEIPEYVHLPLLLNPDKSKLSKRQGDVSTSSYLEKGYLPEAFLNFILLLGWNSKTEQEIFSMEEMIQKFNLEGINKYGAVFNTEKLDWMNGMYIRNMDLDIFTGKCLPYLKEAELIEEISENKFINKITQEEINFEDIEKIVNLEKERIKKFSEIGESIKFAFEKEVSFEKELLAWKKMDANQAQENLKIIIENLDNIETGKFNKENILEIIEKIKTETGLKTGELLWPMRVALSGLKNSPGPFEIAEAIGKEKTLNRVKKAIQL